ncbi:hypothetical protein FOMPIDRAFT_93683 [Fomitopsis schrenkii]|uniref:Uncharacterized protein n=1 Tax=Fomitopsis schrenkii TaxID=2126942 RepID=S8DL49_FOMSC|nr:hypothetical protein FOMPIDRAFT_93683 [Fomitopsis schrenkii]
MGFSYNVWGAVTGGLGLLVFFGVIRLGRPSYRYKRLEEALERAERRIGRLGWNWTLVRGTWRSGVASSGTTVLNFTGTPSSPPSFWLPDITVAITHHVCGAYRLPEDAQITVGA